jgi:type VI secretion system secreted protein Hcp
VENYFLKIDGIPGESHDAKHKDEIDVVSYGWGLTHAPTAPAGGGSGGRAKFQDFHFTMNLNRASPSLFLACANGRHIKTATLSVRKSGGTQVEYLKIKLTDVLVSSFEEAGSGEATADSVGLNFAKVEVDYTPQLPTGAPGAVVEAGWDVKANTPF